MAVLGQQHRDRGALRPSAVVSVSERPWLGCSCSPPRCGALLPAAMRERVFLGGWGGSGMVTSHTMSSEKWVSVSPARFFVSYSEVEEHLPQESEVFFR